MSLTLVQFFRRVQILLSSRVAQGDRLLLVQGRTIQVMEDLLAASTGIPAFGFLVESEVIGPERGIALVFALATPQIVGLPDAHDLPGLPIDEEIGPSF